MTKITGSCTHQTEMCSWIKANQEQIEKHPAWHEDLSAEQAEGFLEGRDPFTYLLRKGGEDHAYYISFMKEDGGIKHQRFTLEYDRKGWYYKNGCNTPLDPTEIVEETLEGLIPRMMHCDFKKCSFIKLQGA